MVTIAVNSPGPLQSWIVDHLLALPAATAAETQSVVRSFRDSVGVALAGSSQESVRWATSYVRRTAARGPASVWGTDLRLDRASAALVNGTSVQALEFDDIAPELAAHLSSTLSAFSDQLKPSRTIDGLVLGWRIAAAVGELIGFESHSRGLQPTHTLGPLVATIATACGLELPEQQMRTALSLAVTGSIGLRASTGTRAKALQSGLAAAAAVRAIELARTGSGGELESGQSVIDSLFALIGADAQKIDDVVSMSLPPPVFVAVKPFPTSGAAHSSIEGVLSLRAMVPEGTVPERLEVRVPPRILRAMAFEVPRIADEARWSLCYVLATAWETGDVDLAEFDDAVVQDSADRRAPIWLDIVGDSTFEPRGERAILTMTAGGAVRTTEIVHRLGYSERPLGDDRVRAKFERCLAGAGHAAVEELWDGLGAEPFTWLDRLGPESAGSRSSFS